MVSFLMLTTNNFTLSNNEFIFDDNNSNDKINL